MMQLDDLGRLEESRGLFGELHHQNRADREIRHNEDARPGRLPGLSRAHDTTRLAEPGPVEAGGPDHHRQASLDTPGQVVEYAHRTSEVHHDVAPLEHIARVVEIDLRDQLEVIS